MIGPVFAAWAFAGIAAVVCLFQLALALGAPWGHLAMGGAFQGVLPPAMRAAALGQMAVLAGVAVVVLARAGIAFPRLARGARRWIWIVVALTFVSALLNLLTPSEGERLLWGPMAVLLFGLSLNVALADRVPSSP